MKGIVKVSVAGIAPRVAGGRQRALDEGLNVAAGAGEPELFASLAK